jgi:hypothetical protein
VGEREGAGRLERGKGKGGEMTQTLYEHRNKKKKELSLISFAVL